MYDLVEWAAAQPWCDGNVGMIGISYFAMTQLEAAVERPPHLKAIFPVAVTADLYEAAGHHGLFSCVVRHAVPVDDRDDLRAQRRVLAQPAARARPAGCCNTPPAAPQVRHDERRGGRDDAAAAAASCRTTRIRGTSCGSTRRSSIPLRDAWWDERNLLPLLENVDIPVYLGCDWQNVPLHLPSTFTRLAAPDQQPVRAGRHARRVRPDLAVGEPARRGAGLVRPLAQGTATPAFSTARRFATCCPARGSGTRPKPGLRRARSRELALRADGALGADEGAPGGRARSWCSAPA